MDWHARLWSAPLGWGCRLLLLLGVCMGWSWPAPSLGENADGAVAELMLVENGKARACIVIPESADEGTKAAAEDIQKTIELSTRVVMPVVTENNAKHPVRIHVGNRPFAESLGIHLPSGIGFHDEYIVVKRIGSDIVVVGNDSGPFRGTQDAAIRFLREVVGADYYYPAPLGKVVPKRHRLVVGKLDITEGPASGNRSIAMYGERSQAEEDRMMEWFRWNHSGGAEFGHQHIFYQIAPPEKYFEKHPEYYYENVHGERSVDHGWQLCTTNRDVIQLAADFVRDYFQNHPDHLGAPLSANDSDMMCLCKECRKLDLPDPASGGARRMLTFANAVAREVAKTHPGKYVAFYAYLGTLNPPTEMQAEPNVIVVIADSDNCLFHGIGDPNCGMARDTGDRFDAWSKITSNIKFYDYYGLYGDYSGLPFSNITRTIHNAHFLQSRGGLGFHYDALFVPGPQGLHYWTAMRSLWDADLTPEAARRQYCDGLYGDASAAMQDYYRHLEEYCLATDSHSVHVTWVLPGPLYIWNDSVVASLVEDLRKAAALVSRDSAAFARIQQQSDLIQFASIFTKLKQAQIKYQQNNTRDNKDHYGQLRRAYLSQYEKLADQDLISFNPHWLDVYAPEGPGLKSVDVSIRPTPTSPSLDPLDYGDDAWVRYGHAVYCFSDENGFLAYPKSEAYVACDENHLYVLFDLRDYHLSQIKEDAQSEDDPLWQDDAVRLLLQVPGAGADSVNYDFIVNAGGAKGDTKNQDPEWDGEWAVQTARSDVLGARKWAVRVQIPWSTLGLVQAPDMIQMNLSRHSTAISVAPVTSWVPTLGNVDNPLATHATVRISKPND